MAAQQCHVLELLRMLFTEDSNTTWDDSYAQIFIPNKTGQKGNDEAEK